MDQAQDANDTLTRLQGGFICQECHGRGTYGGITLCKGCQGSGFCGCSSCGYWNMANGYC